MPFITIEHMPGRTLDQRRQFARKITEAAVEVFSTTPDKVRIVFRELSTDDLARGGVLVSDEGKK
jgi:4-oxalocrotonate tautomerase